MENPDRFIPSGRWMMNRARVKDASAGAGPWARTASAHPAEKIVPSMARCPWKKLPARNGRMPVIGRFFTAGAIRHKCYALPFPGLESGGDSRENQPFPGRSAGRLAGPVPADINTDVLTVSPGRSMLGRKKKNEQRIQSLGKIDQFLAIYDEDYATFLGREHNLERERHVCS
ncbi:MAG: hypothetical protein IPK65_11910, partial [Gammaproteobacteria bacterium]|nr:hypothetical protein [Gammaproteobacteria bacterium]